MKRVRLGLIVAIVLGTTPLTDWGGVGALAATTACNGNTSGADIRVDVNGDGCADAVVGMPDRTVGGVAQAGAIEVSLGSSGYNRLRARTVLVTACSTAHPLTTSPYSGPNGFLARVGFNPNSPHADAG